MDISGDLSWDDAQTFLAVAEQRTFSAAARQLGCGQPTISRKIADLEGRLGVQLFQRGKQGALLTGAGARLLPAAEQMARWAGEFQRLARGESPGLAGPLRLAAPPGLAVDFLAPFAAVLREEAPELRLEVLASIEHVDLSRGAADLAIRTREPREPELTSLHRAQVALGVFAAPSYLARLPAKPSLADIDWITWSFPYLHLEPRPTLEGAIDGFEPAFSSDNYLVLKSALMRGVGAMILERTTHPLALDAELVEIDLGIDLPESELHLVCAKSTQYVPRVRAVADRLIAEMARVFERKS